MEYENTLVINFTIKWSFIVHTIIQFLVKSHFLYFYIYLLEIYWDQSFYFLAKLATLEQGTNFFSFRGTYSNLTDAHKKI